MEKILKNVTISIVTNDMAEPDERVNFDGSLRISKDWRKVDFAESAPKRPKARNTRVFEGELLTTVAKPDGSYQLHTKNINPLKIKDFPQRMFSEASALVEKLKGRR